MRITKRQLKTLIESILLESEKWYSKTEETEYGRAAKQIFKVPGKEIEIYVFPDATGQQPEEFKTPDGPKYYYGSGDQMEEAEVISSGEKTFVYHSSSKPEKIDMMKEGYDDLSYANQFLVDRMISKLKKDGLEDHASEILNFLEDSDVKNDDFNNITSDEDIKLAATQYVDGGNNDKDLETLIDMAKKLL